MFFFFYFVANKRKDLFRFQFKTMKKELILLITMLLFTACKQDPKAELKELVAYWQDREIIFPEAMQFSRYAEEVVNYPFQEAQNKVLIYIDSVGCTSCKLQLSRWKELMAYTDSLTNGSLPYVFIFQSSDSKKIKGVTKLDHFDHPVYLDRNADFVKLNPLPDNSSFHTFLLDKNNKVLVIGNPVLNPTVKDLYVKEISGMPTEDKLAETQLMFETVEYDLGTIQLGDTIERQIKLRNSGSSVFRLKDIISSCDCTEGFAAWTLLEAGKEDEITMRYKADKEGDFLRTLTLYGNIPEESVTLQFIGVVK